MILFYKVQCLQDSGNFSTGWETGSHSRRTLLHEVFSSFVSLSVCLFSLYFYSLETKYETCRQFWSKLLSIKFHENSSSNIPAFTCGGTNTDKTGSNQRIFFFATD